MPRDKFRVIGRYLSFYDHDIPPNTDDRHYRLRFVIETLNKSFRACYKLGKYIAFDEATFACVSKFLPARVFNPMKPHRYGLKVFMTCCGVTGYCFGFEMYQGAGTPNQDDAFDKKSGPQALFRAMKEFKDTWRVVVCDRFYTSVMVFLQLLEIGVFAIGTIMPDRKGFPAQVIIGKDKVNDVSRGHLFMAWGAIGMNFTKTVGQFLAVGWMDSKPVHLLATGISNDPISLLRRVAGVPREFTIPKAMHRYHKYMGGVDQSDFMRMARYSVQQAYHTRKWYKSIFLSLFDLAIVNAYILHNIVFPVDKPIFLTRPEFMYALADEMIHYVHMLDVTGVKRRRGGDKVSENPCTAGHTVQG